MKHLLLLSFFFFGLSSVQAEETPAPSCVDFSGVWTGHCQGPQGSYSSNYLIEQEACDTLKFYDNQKRLKHEITIGEEYHHHFLAPNGNFYDLNDTFNWNRKSDRLNISRVGSMDSRGRFYEVEASGNLKMSRDRRTLIENAQWEYYDFNRVHIERFRCSYRYRGEVDRFNTPLKKSTRSLF